MTFSFPFATSAGTQKLFDGVVTIEEALIIGILPALAAFIFTTGNEFRKWGDAKN